MAHVSKLLLGLKSNTVLSYVATLFVCLAATGLCFLLFGRLAFSNLVMIYLLGVAIVSTAFGAAEAVLSAFLSIALLNFFFVPPRFTFSVADTQYLITFMVMLGVALLISSLTQTLRSHMLAAENREERAATLLELSRKLSRSRSKRQIGESALASVQAIFPCDAALYVAEGSRPELIGETDGRFVDVDLVEESLKREIKLESADGCSYIPLQATGRAVGVLVVERKDSRAISPAQADLLNAFANQTAVALERAILAKQSHQANLEVETERLKNALLSSVSHDLRTPLTSILGASSSLLHEPPQAKAKELLTTIRTESERLDRLVRNLLDMTRLEAGHMELKLEWNSLEELIGSALSRTEALLGTRHVRVEVGEEVPLIEVDGVLMEQVFVNLLENAVRHTPRSAEIEIKAFLDGPFVRVEVSDNGPGLPAGEEEAMFEKFHRGQKQASSGTGLGLTICRAILKAHGSRIWAKNRPDGGALIVLELKAKSAPEPPVE